MTFSAFFLQYVVSEVSNLDNSNLLSKLQENNIDIILNQNSPSGRAPG